MSETSNYRLTITYGQTTVYVWRTLQQHRSVHYDMADGSYHVGATTSFRSVEGCAYYRDTERGCETTGSVTTLAPLP